VVGKNRDREVGHTGPECAGDLYPEVRGADQGGRAGDFAVLLEDQDTRAQITLISDTCPSTTPVTSYDVLLPAGTYDAYFSSSSCGESIPCSSRTRVDGPIAVTGPKAHNLDVTAVVFTGSFTTNRSPLGCPEYGRLFMEDHDTGAQVTLISDTCPSTTPVSTFDVLVPTSTYSVYFSVSSCGPTVPCSSRAFADCIRPAE